MSKFRLVRQLFYRIETLFLIVLIIFFWIYTRWMIARFRPIIRGSSLVHFDLRTTMNRVNARLISFGFTNLTREAGNAWKYGQKNFCYYAMQGVRSTMEDRMHYLRDPYNANLSIFGIFDGHGGKFVSEYLEAHFSNALRSRLLKLRISDSNPLDSDNDSDSHSLIGQEIVKEILKIDGAISRLDPALTSLTGSTLIAAIIQGSRFVTIVNVGDSRAVVCQQNGTARPLSVDHKPANSAEKERIESAGGFVSWNGVFRVQGILATSRAFGDTYLKRLDVLTAHPDIRVLDLITDPARFLILASDGLWDVVDNQQAVDIVSRMFADDRDCHEAVEHLVKTAINRHTVDNVSAFIIRFEQFV